MFWLFSPECISSGYCLIFVSSKQCPISTNSLLQSVLINTKSLISSRYNFLRQCKWKWFVISVRGRLYAETQYRFEIFGNWWQNKNESWLPLLISICLQGANFVKRNEKLIMRYFPFTKVGTSCAFDTACDFVWHLQMEVKAWFSFDMIHMNRSIVCECTEPWIPFLDFQTDSNVTFRFIQVIDTKFHCWHLRVFS